MQRYKRDKLVNRIWFYVWIYGQGMTQKLNGQGENQNEGKVVRRDARGRLLPGHGGLKPKGTKSKPRALLKKVLETIGTKEAFLDEDGNPVDYDAAILKRLADLAVGGDLQAIQIWMAYRYGRPVPMEAEKGNEDSMARYLRRLEAETGRSSWNPADNARDITEVSGNGQTDLSENDQEGD